ncbi:type II toxin-antitoxin system VapC family toxin [Adhaeribacter rhizoryzae]|uniref:Ribonuclease VapC n=1 Tax=Adhaeribacter rhizoryzae TaxID=2607907 RepID=A0A5M6DNE6_9BACT|nr:type II toxin-antitoxin system VapC family toxin [Adhaeribacter rhizoryzae]KAA5547926.1 type II toxin-antitoxin system VapC family toxin [Adhaeribacter rhizoryzae]
MSGNSLFVDTNILLYLISGDETVAELLDGKHIAISFVTELELLGYKVLAESDLKIIQELINEATIIDINAEIKRLVISLRKNYKIKLPDAIVVASALYSNLPLVTADKQLSQINELTMLLYKK